MFELGQCATPHPCCAKLAISAALTHTAWANQTSGAHPIQFLHVRHGPVPEHLQAELFLVLGLGQVRVQMNAMKPRQFG